MVCILQEVLHATDADPSAAAAASAPKSDTHLEHRDRPREQRLVVLPGAREGLHAPERAQAERALLTAHAVVRLVEVVPVDQSLRQGRFRARAT